MTAQIWRPSQAGHQSYGAWVSVDRHGGVFLICLHPQCIQRGRCNKRLLGQTPLSLLTPYNVAGDNDDQSKDIFSTMHRPSRSKGTNTTKQRNQGEDSGGPNESLGDPAQTPKSPPTRILRPNSTRWMSRKRAETAQLRLIPGAVLIGSCHTIRAMPKF